MQFSRVLGLPQRPLLHCLMLAASAQNDILEGFDQVALASHQLVCMMQLDISSPGSSRRQRCLAELSQWDVCCWAVWHLATCLPMRQRTSGSAWCFPEDS